jgi:predicted TIM-barrel fold metal-dependent hydrolase
MEAGCGWLPFWLERLDEHYELMPDQAPNIDRPPSEYLLDSNRCFIGVECTDTFIPFVARTLGQGIVTYASDYCHFDSAFPDTVRMIVEREDLTEDEKARILAGNASVLYGIEIP